MRRKERLAAKHAAGRGKGRPTPKQPHRNLTRAQHTALLSRRARRELEGTPSAMEKVLATIRGGQSAEKAALEKMLREAGAVDLSAGKRHKPAKPTATKSYK